MTGDNSIKNGFTLIELLVAVTIFSVVVTSFFGLFSSAFQEQRKNLDLQYLLQNISYSAEYISRALRMARKDLSGDCITVKHNFAAIADGIRFLNYDGECQEFFLEGETLKIRKSTDGSSSNFGSSEPVTPQNIGIDNLRFEISGENQLDTLQPKVTFTLSIRNKTPEPQTLSIQTTISQRELDVQK